MSKIEKKVLADEGQQIVLAQVFLGKDGAEAAIAVVRASLAACIHERRGVAKLTQGQLAERAGTTQARVAKAEHGHPDISLDLFLRLLFALGSDPAKIARALSR